MSLILIYANMAYSMPSPEFLQNVGRNSELLKQSIQIRQKARANYELTDNFWATGIEAQIGLLESEVSGLTKTLQTGLQSQVSVSQGSSVGLSAAFVATYFDDDDRDASESFSVNLEQKLWRNSFGGSSRALLSAAEKNLKADNLEADLKSYEACDQAYDLFFSAWKSQEQLNILKDVLKLASQSFNITRKNYRRKLIRKLEFESAHVDFLGVQDRVLDAENQWARDSENYKRYAKLSGPLKYSFSAFISQPSARYLNAEITRLRYEALISVKDQQKLESRTDVSLFAEIEKTKSASLAGLDFADTDNYLVGFKMDFPWFNNQPSSEYKSALADAAQAEQVWAKQLGDQKVQVEYLYNLLNELEEKIKRQTQRLKLRVSQVRQASRYLNSGRMEFDDYLRYRNGELEERLRGLALIHSYWGTRLDILRATGDGASKLCAAFKVGKVQ